MIAAYCYSLLRLLYSTSASGSYLVHGGSWSYIIILVESRTVFAYISRPFHAEEEDIL